MLAGGSMDDALASMGVSALIVVALASAVLLHEAGHLLCAWSVRLPVKEFNVGFGPRVGSFQFGGTRYVVRGFLLGGYVRFDERKTELLEDGVMLSKLDAMPAASRLWVLVGGPLANIVSAWSCLWVSGITIGVPQASEPLPGLLVQELPPEAATRTGLREGDVLLRLGGRSLAEEGSAALDGLEAFVQQLGTQRPVECIVARGGDELRLEVALQADPDTGLARLGAVLIENREQVWRHVADPGQAAAMATDVLSQLLTATFESLSGLASGETELAGPLGAIADGQELAAGSGLIGVGIFFVVANVNLALVNAMPVPALDGGKALFVLAECLQGRRVDEDFRRNVEFVFAIALLLGLAGLTARDVQLLVSATP